MEKVPSSSEKMVHLFIQPSEGEPISFKLDLYQARKVITILAFTTLVFFLGTLFFFREFEINRKLQAAVLEANLKLQLKTISVPEISIPKRQLGYSVNFSEDEELRKTKSMSETSEETDISKDSWVNFSHSVVSARLGSLSSECQASNCTIKLELLPSGNGVSQGELLIVLEAEVPRIGARGINLQQRKQFIFYPGYSSKEEFKNSDISTFEKRPFKFSKTLNASLNFKVSKLLRPLAINVYLFDQKKTLTHHERKTIDLDENYAN